MDTGISNMRKYIRDKSSTFSILQISLNFLLKSAEIIYNQDDDGGVSWELNIKLIENTMKTYCLNAT